jgi:hypothetical protein
MNDMPLPGARLPPVANRDRPARRPTLSGPLLGMLLLGLGLAPGVTAGPVLKACVNFACREQQSVPLSDAEWLRVQRLFQAAPTPAAERAAIAQAIALLEQQVGRATDTWRDLAGNWQRAGEPGELDCIAESRNTSHYLRKLEDAGLLRWHRTRERVMRGIVLVHWTAVLEALDDGSQWAVDSWFRDNGRPPVIIPLAQWYDYEEPES